jgi:hypothetical protein
MLFELPHYALELLVLLPCVQVLCSRLRVLATPSVPAPLLQGGDAAAAQAIIRREYVPNVLRGCWERAPQQARLLPRLKANTRVLVFCVLLLALAAGNSLLMPLALEDAVTSSATAWSSDDPAAAAVAARLSAYSSAGGGRRCPPPDASILRSAMAKHGEEISRMMVCVGCWVCGCGCVGAYDGT